MSFIDEKQQLPLASGFTIETVTIRDSETPAHGIGIWVAALFLLGALAGAGIVAMPFVFKSAGWWAIVLVTVMSAIGCYTGFQLSWCWSILQDTWPEYNEHTRNPYPEIAFRAGGRLWKYSVQICVFSSMFGASVAFLIYASNNISILVKNWLNLDINYCYMVVIVGGCMLPLLFLGTPKDFWPIALGAIAATTVAIGFIIWGTVNDMAACKNKVYFPPINTKGFISAYCTVCFAYGGHSAFPTIQHDMKRPAKFPVSVLISFVSLFILYFPMPILAYIVYGHTISGTIEENLSTEWIQEAIMILITGHVLFAFFIVSSPVVQDLERLLRIPLHFSWQRICTRTFMMAMALLLALTLPDFNALLELVGGTTLAATAYMFPGPLYLVLRYKSKKVVKALNGNSLNGNAHNELNGNSMKTKLHESKSSPPEKSQLPGFLNHYSPDVHGIMTCREFIVNTIVVLVGVVGALAAIYGFVSRESHTMRKPCFLTNMHLVSRLVESSGDNSTGHHCYRSIINNVTLISKNYEL